MPHLLRRRARLALGAVKASILGALVATAFGLGPEPEVVQRGEISVSTGPPAHARPGPVDRKLAEHRCSVTGFETGDQPASALVRSARGSLRLVDFATGWRIYTGHGPATLVAVCLAAPPVRNSLPVQPVDA